MRKSIALVVSDLIIGATLGVYGHSTYVKDHAYPDSPEPLMGGWLAFHPFAMQPDTPGYQDLERTSMRMEHVDAERKVIEVSREGFGDVPADQLQRFVSDLTWAEGQFPSDSPLRLGLDRDIAWSKTRLQVIGGKS
jgi:hypothetical protein